MQKAHGAGWRSHDAREGCRERPTDERSNLRSPNFIIRPGGACSDRVRRMLHSHIDGKTRIGPARLKEHECRLGRHAGGEVKQRPATRCRVGGACICERKDLQDQWRQAIGGLTGKPPQLRAPAVGMLRRCGARAARWRRPLVRLERRVSSASMRLL